MAVQINVAANQAALVASIQAGVQAYNQRFANNNPINLNINARAFSQPLGRITGDVKDFEAALAASNARVIAFGASTAVLGGVIRSFKELANVTIQVEKSLADINRVFGLTTSQLQKFSTDLFAVSKQTASSFDDASKAALEFSRQGLKAEEVLVRTKDALTLTRLAGIGTANAVDALTSTVNGFAATGVTTTQILNKLVAVEQDYAVGAGDLAEALSRTGQAAQEAGVSLDQLNALVTAAQQSTARGGAVIGNALKTIFTRLQRTETLDQLEAFNISVRDVQGNILPAVTILQNFAGAYQNLADAQRAQLSEQVAGVYQVNILKAIVNDLNKSQGVYAGALQRGASATNEAEMATAKLNKTLDALLSQTATSAQQLANNIGKVTFEPLARYGTEQLKSLVENMNEILEGEGIGSTFANGFLKGIRNVIAGPGAIAAFFTLFKLIQNSFTYLSQALPQIAGITTETQNRKNIESAILQIMSQQGVVAQALDGLTGNQAAQAQLLLQTARAQTAEYQKQAALAQQLAVQLSSQGVKVAGNRGLQVTRAGGYVPTPTKLAEVIGAKAGGYTPGAVVPSPVGGVMNTAEDVRYIPGFAQPFINPPANSKAGRVHRQNAISRTGVDPYMAGGFIPNFVFDSVDAIKLNAIKAVTDKTDFFDNFSANINPIELGKNINEYRQQAENIIGASAAVKRGTTINGGIYTPKGQRDPSKKTPSFNRDNLAQFIKTYRNQVSSSTLKRTVTSLKGLDSNFEYSLNQVQGLLGEADAKNLLKNSKVTQANDYFDLIKNDGSLAEVRTRSKINKRDILKKAILEHLKTAYYKNGKDESINLGSYDVIIPKGSQLNSNGFIPNFAPPTSAMRIPWFKKFANPAYDNIQPTLGISKASDVDTFRQTQFRSTAKNADKQGDPNIFGPLYEAFGKRALQLVNQSNIFGELVAGSALQPGAIRDQTAFDAGFLQKAGIVGVDYKGFPKINLSGGSVAKHMTDKYNRVVKTDPEQASKIKEAIMIFNEPGNQNQLPSEFGKNFIQLAGTSYSEMLKNTPNFVKELSNETNMLLDKYVKNPQFLRMNAASGFVPNFAYKQAVMGLEESMSGNKAIFDTKPFPHIRNSSQPTFSSAIADHGGLGNALSDSMRGQKAVGLMNKGFIPNFAGPRSIKRRMARNQAQNTQSGFDPNQIQADAERVAQDVIKKITYAYNYIDGFVQTFITEIETLSNNTKNTLGPAVGKAKSSIGSMSNGISSSFSGLANKINSPEFKNKLSSAFNNIGIFGPLIAGQLESFVIGNKKRTQMTENERMLQSGLSTGLTAVSTGADIGNRIFPGLGGAVGAVVGGLVGLTSALDAAKLSAEELMELNQEQVQKSQASISAASSYIEAQKSLTQMIASGASSSDIEIATKKLSDNFNEIKDVKLQEIFNATGGDVALMTKQLQDYTNQVTKESARKTGLYGGNLKPEERASALAIGLGETGSIDFMNNAREAIKKANDAAEKEFLFQSRIGDTSTAGITSEFAKRQVIKQFAESQVPQNEPQRKSSVESLIKNLLDENFEEVFKFLEKRNIISDTNKAAVNFKQAATRSFNQIFLDMEQQIAKTSFEIALSFEKDSGSRRIQSAILDFSTNFQDSINSFLSNNLPDARKFDFTANTAAQKAQLQLQKSQQDYNKALAEQENDKSNFLIKNAENLTKEFKSSFLPSQAAAEFYQSNVLPQIQKGTFSADAKSLAQQFEKASFQKAESKFSEAGMAGGLNKNNIASELNRVTKVMEALADAGLTNEDQYKKLQEAQKALIDLQNQTALYQNTNEMTRLQNVIDTAAREKQLFETKQANAKKELEINKQLSDARILVEKDIAIQKAKVDKENLMRMEGMKNISATISNNLDIEKARATADINAIQRRLEDPRETFGMGVSQISERKFVMQDQILQRQRDMEDQTINAEIQQRILEMAAEQENTAALIKLNDTIMTLVETQLRESLGGSVKIEEINSMRMAGVSPESIDNALGKNTYAQFQALERIQESRAASAANNSIYNTNDFSKRMEEKNFNTMNRDEQLNFLASQRAEAEKAGNITLAGTIKRYEEQIVAKKEVLRLTREDVDKQTALTKEIERQNNTFSGRFKKGFGNLKKESDEIMLNLGENLPKMFADGIVSGIKAAIKEADNLGDALMGIAANFLDAISTAMMQSAVYGLLGRMGVPNLPTGTGGGKQRGGIIRAQSGMYISGTGSGDKYPALLENGEYVLNRKAVMAMGGPAELDKLNFSMAPRFASGGTFSAELTDLKSMEEGMTTFGLENSRLYGELRDIEKERAAQALAKKRKRQAMIAGLVGSLAGAVASFGMGKLAGKFGSSLKKDFGDTAMNVTPEQLAQNANLAQRGGHIGTRLSDKIPAYAEGGLFNNPMVKKFSTGMQVGGMYSPSSNNSSVVNNSSATNAFNFNTTVNRDGTIQMGANTTSYKQQDVELSDNLNSRIYGAVLEVIKEQQRFGGTLAGTRKPI